MVPNGRNRQNSDSLAAKPKPHFCATMFQIPIPDRKLMIPTRSAMKFGKELCGVVTLTDPNGLAWQVGVEKDGENIWLHDGLQEFLDYYAVHYFYNLHFRYEGNSAFFVCICDSFGSEIDYPCYGPSKDVNHDAKGAIGGYVEQQSPSKRHNFLCQQEIGSPTKRRRNAASMDSVLCGDANHTRSRMLEKEAQVDPEGLINGGTSERGKAKENKKPWPPNLLVKREGEAEMHVPLHLVYGKSSRLVISKETEKAIHVASLSKVENPSFMVILRPYNFSERHVDVPIEFVKRHLSQCSEDIQLQVHNGTGKWLVRCFYRFKNGSRTTKRIGKGWPQFSTNNNLKVGDVCVFELMKKEKDIVMRVWIYRAADYATPV